MKKLYADCHHVTPETLMNRSSEKCDTYFTKHTYNYAKPAVYWWNQSIAEKRKKCIEARRVLTRNRRCGSVDQIEALEKAYQQSRHDLKKEIRMSKRQKWTELCQDLNNNKTLSNCR